MRLSTKHLGDPGERTDFARFPETPVPNPATIAASLNGGLAATGASRLPVPTMQRLAASFFPWGRLFA